MDMKSAIYFNFIVVYYKFALQEILNAEQLGRPRPFPFLRDFRLQGGFALTLAACSVRNFISPGFGGRYSPSLDMSRSSC